MNNRKTERERPGSIQEEYQRKDGPDPSDEDLELQEMKS